VAHHAIDVVVGGGVVLAEIAAGFPVLLAALGAAGLLAAGIAARRRSPWTAFGILWFLAALIPVAQGVRIGAVMADRFLYLPAAGACAALAAGLLALPRRARGALLVVVLLAFAAGTHHREQVWRNDATMARDVVERTTNYPDDADAWNRLALWHAARGESDREERAYRRGLAAEPDNRYLGKNLGALLYERGRYAEAREVLFHALRKSGSRDRQAALIAYNLARVLLAEDRTADAVRVLVAALPCRPAYAGVDELLGEGYRDRLGRAAEAESLRRRAREIREAARRGRAASR